MALPPLNAPPIRTPLVGSDGRITPAWEKWFDILWRKTGAETNTAPISVAGAAANVPPAPTVGVPVIATSPGSFALDEDTGQTYYNPSGESGDWQLLL